MFLRKQCSLATAITCCLFASAALANPPAAGGAKSSPVLETDGATSALRTQTLELPATEGSTPAVVQQAANSQTIAPTSATTTSAQTAAPASQPATNPVPPMGAPGEAGQEASSASKTAGTTAATTANPLADISPLLKAPITAADVKKNPLLDLGTDQPFNLTQSIAVVVLSLAGLALFGVSLVKFRNKSITTQTKPEKPMQILSTLPLSPKRQIILVRIRDQEIVLSSTEQGVTMLTEVGGRPQTHPMLGEYRRERDVAMPRTQELIQETRETMAKLLPSREDEETRNNDTSANKSEMLLKALNNIKDKKIARKPVEEKSESADVKTPVMKQTKAAFPKYLANAFQQEAKRELGKTRETTQSGEDDSVENVTRMIREKLKTMQPAGN